MEAVVIKTLRARNGDYEDLWLLTVEDRVVAIAKSFDEIKKLALEQGFHITRYEFVPMSKMKGIAKSELNGKGINAQH